MNITDEQRVEMAVKCLAGILSKSGCGTTNESFRENAEDALRSAEALIELMEAEHAN